MSSKPYGMICPITRVCEILEPRWTIPIIVALWAGNTKFNEIRREVGSVSPALLSRRLKELEALGLVERVEDKATGAVDYIRTEAAIALEPALDALAFWGQRYIKAELALCTASASSMMWKMRGMIDVGELPKRRVVLQFHFNDEGLEYDTYWVIAQPDAEVEICSSIPGFEVDLFIETNVPSLLGVILGRTTIARETDLGELFVSGDALLARTMARWLPVSPYSKVDGVEQLDDARDWDAARQAYSVRQSAQAIRA